jgi:predicted molibdopterin-dependent oxidoreductase YjgC
VSAEKHDPVAVGPLFRRLKDGDRPPVAFFIDGEPRTALAGDTVLTAMLNSVSALRAESGSVRAGFCQMGACQDCWVEVEGGGRVRSCTTPVEEGMRLLSSSEGGR